MNRGSRAVTTSKGDSMAYYRLYFLDGFGHIKHFREFEARSDVIAVAQAEKWSAQSAMELWSERRKVRSWESPAVSAEARARSILRTLRPLA
jgi:hypothetical protein